MAGSEALRQDHLARIALPLGGIGTGTVSLGGRGDLRDWEIMNRPAKGYVPIAYGNGKVGPFFALFAKAEGRAQTRVLEGPFGCTAYEGDFGSAAPNHGLPRFRRCAFAAAYPFGQVFLSDPDMPVDARLEAFNPMIPADADRSGIPVAVLRYVLRNKTARSVAAAVCGVLPNFIGMDGSARKSNWVGNPETDGARANRNRFREGRGVRGVFMDTTGVDPDADSWGTLCLATTASGRLSHRTGWLNAGWGTPLLDFWDDFSGDGRLEERVAGASDMPMASLAAGVTIPPGGERQITFLLTWHFPNRITWTPKAASDCCGEECRETRESHRQLLCHAIWRRLGRGPAGRAPTVRNWNGARSASWRPSAPAICRMRSRRPPCSTSARCGRQTCFRTADGRFLRLGGLRRISRLLPWIVHARVELRAGHAVPVRSPRPQHAARSSSPMPRATTA